MKHSIQLLQSKTRAAHSQLADVKDPSLKLELENRIADFTAAIERLSQPVEAAAVIPEPAAASPIQMEPVQQLSEARPETITDATPEELQAEAKEAAESALAEAKKRGRRATKE